VTALTGLTKACACSIGDDVPYFREVKGSQVDLSYSIVVVLPRNLIRAVQVGVRGGGVAGVGWLVGSIDEIAPSSNYGKFLVLRVDDRKSEHDIRSSVS